MCATRLTKIAADFQSSLATKLSIGGTSATLLSVLDDDGNALANGNYFLTFDGDNSQKEHLLVTLNGTALTSIKSVSRQGVQTSGAVREHRVGAKVVLTDFAILKELTNLLDGTYGLDSSNPLAYDGVADMTGNDNKLATVAYVKGVAIAGAPNANSSTKGIVKLSVDQVSPSNPIAVGQNDPKFVEYFAETGAADAYVITPAPAISAYAVGQRFSFKAAHANTGASTLNINALGAKTIKNSVGADLIANDILAGQIVVVEYDGTNFQMLNPSGNAKMPLGYLDTDTTMAANSDARVASQKAAKAYADTKDTNVYLGSQSLSEGANTITAGYQSAWKYCVINIKNQSGSGYYYQADVIIFKNGKTSAESTQFITGPSQQGFQASVSGTTITITRIGGTSLGGTAYYYQ